MTEKDYKNQVKSDKKVVSNLELLEKQFEKTVKDKIACITHLKLKNDCFKHIFGILIKFSIQ